MGSPDFSRRTARSCASRDASIVLSMVLFIIDSSMASSRLRFRRGYQSDFGMSTKKITYILKMSKLQSLQSRLSCASDGCPFSRSTDSFLPSRERSQQGRRAFSAICEFPWRFSEEHPWSRLGKGRWSIAERFHTICHTLHVFDHTDSELQSVSFDE